MRELNYPTPLYVGYYKLPHCDFPPTSVPEDDSLDLWCNPHDGEDPECLYRNKYRTIWEIPTGISLDIPKGWTGLVLDRASQLAKSDVRVMGKISSSYKGEVFILASTSFDDLPFTKGQKVCQIIFVPHIEVYQRSVKPLPGGRKRGY